MKEYLGSGGSLANTVQDLFNAIAKREQLLMWGIKVYVKPGLWTGSHCVCVYNYACMCL